MTRKTILAVAALAVAWMVLAIVQGIFLTSPFAEARDAAVEIGGWESDDVVFLQGRYGFRFFYTQVSARLEARADGARQPVEIELRHVPFLGWRVVGFSRGEARPVAAQRVTRDRAPAGAPSPPGSGRH